MTSFYGYRCNYGHDENNSRLYTQMLSMRISFRFIHYFMPSKKWALVFSETNSNGTGSGSGHPPTLFKTGQRHATSTKGIERLGTQCLHLPGVPACSWHSGSANHRPALSAVRAGHAPDLPHRILLRRPTQGRSPCY